jgi:hypothetical protein
MASLMEKREAPVENSFEKTVFFFVVNNFYRRAQAMRTLRILFRI